MPQLDEQQYLATKQQFSKLQETLHEYAQKFASMELRKQLEAFAQTETKILEILSKLVLSPPVFVEILRHVDTNTADWQPTRPHSNTSGTGTQSRLIAAEAVRFGFYSAISSERAWPQLNALDNSGLEHTVVENEWVDLDPEFEENPDQHPGFDQDLNQNIGAELYVEAHLQIVLPIDPDPPEQIYPEVAADDNAGLN